MKNVELLDANYPEVDMQNLPYEYRSFDFVISGQVIEHLEDPKQAIVGIHTTCFMNYIHLCPKDYWRFSSDALKYLCKDFSEILCCEGWGNRIAILLCFFKQ
jgi:hypothetical protein